MFLAMRVLVTGTAGFIGYHLAQRLLAEGCEVIGVDCFSDYYDVQLKEARAARLRRHRAFSEIRQDIADGEAMARIFADERPSHCVNLAAQAGVRYSLRHPWSYSQANLTGFLSILEACRHHPVEHLVFASTSSVYGANESIPFSEHDSAEHPLTLYAATKKANEMMAHSYAHLFAIPATGVRFFTAYGPWGRPDMALFLFTKAILEERAIEVFNHGDMERDFTYIDDIIEGLCRLLRLPPKPDETWQASAPDPASSGIAPYRVVNLGNGRREQLRRYIEILEDKLGRHAQKVLLPMQAGDVPITWADTEELSKLIGPLPHTPIEVGIERFVAWYLDYYGHAN
jgi:UDP-glucuronate 4-epimerase